VAKGDIEIAIDANASGAIKGFKQAEGAAHRAARSINAGAKLAAAGLVAAGASAVILAKNAAEDAAAARRLSIALKNTTGATDKQVKSVESWISKQGLLYGVSDDQLRPAIQRLAQVTGSVTKAQRLATLAMNISAGTGKDLGVVTQALVRAQNGNVAAVGKLGLATKDASGHTKTFKQLQSELAKTFKGQASAAASSAQGKMQRFKVAIDEAQESIGYLLLPALAAIATLMVTKVVPAVNATITWLTKHKTIAIAVGIAVAAFAAAFIVASAALKVYSAGTKIVTAVTKTWTGIQWALNAAMSANPIGLVVLAIAALVIGMVIAYKKSEKFRDIVNKVFHAIADVALWLWNNVLSKVFEFWAKEIGVVMLVWSKLLGALSHVPGFGWVKGIADKLHAASDEAMHLNLHIDATGKKNVKPTINGASITKARTDTQLLNVALSGLQTKNPKIHIDTSSIDVANVKLDRLLSKLARLSRGLLTPALTQPGVPAGATGGIVTRPTLALIGEAGPEAVVPLNRTAGSSPLPTGISGSGLAGQRVTLSIAGRQIEAVFEEIADSRVNSAASMQAETERAFG
jgi:hypothetical protein